LKREERLTGRTGGIASRDEIMTWQELIELEPRLLALYNRALAIRNGKRTFIALDVWIGSRRGMKDEMMELVGWSRKDKPALATDEAYNVAYDKIYYEGLLGEVPESE
jgi:hypothetical protein